MSGRRVRTPGHTQACTFHHRPPGWESYKHDKGFDKTDTWRRAVGHRVRRTGKPVREAPPTLPAERGCTHRGIWPPHSNSTSRTLRDCDTPELNREHGEDSMWHYGRGHGHPSDRLELSRHSIAVRRRGSSSRVRSRDNGGSPTRGDVPAESVQRTGDYCGAGPSSRQ